MHIIKGIINSTNVIYVLIYLNKLIKIIRTHHIQYNELPHPIYECLEKLSSSGLYLSDIERLSNLDYPTDLHYLYKYDDLGENNNLDDFKRLGNLNYSLVGLCIQQIIKKNVDKNKLKTTSDRYFTDEKIIKEIINSHICSFVIKIVNKRKHLNFRIYTSK